MIPLSKQIITAQLNMSELVDMVGCSEHGKSHSSISLLSEASTLLSAVTNDDIIDYTASIHGTQVFVNVHVSLTTSRN